MQKNERRYLNDEKSQRSDAEKNKVIETGKRIGINKIISQNNENA